MRKEVLEIMAAKRPISFRLSETTIKDLKRLSDRWHISQADVIALLIHVAEDDTYEDLDDMVNLIQKT
jgi:hypothetical protein